MERRNKKNKIKINDTNSFEKLLQEIYIDACNQTQSAQQVIDYLSITFKAENVDELTKIAKEKTAAIKLKESGAKLKLEVSKILNEVIKSNGNVDEAVNKVYANGSTTAEGFKNIREMIKENSKKEL